MNLEDLRKQIEDKYAYEFEKLKKDKETALHALRIVEGLLNGETPPIVATSAQPPAAAPTRGKITHASTADVMRAIKESDGEFSSRSIAKALGAKGLQMHAGTFYHAVNSMQKKNRVVFHRVAKSVGLPMVKTYKHIMSA